MLIKIFYFQATSYGSSARANQDIFPTWPYWPSSQYLAQFQKRGLGTSVASLNASARCEVGNPFSQREAHFPPAAMHASHRAILHLGALDA